MDISKYSKVPPHATDIEKSVLGVILMNSGSFETVNELLQADFFYLDAHKCVYEAMTDIAAKNGHIEPVSVVEQLKKNEKLELVGGPYGLSKIFDGVTSHVGIENKCRIIIEKHIQREVIRITGELHSIAYEDSTDAFDLLEQAEGAILGISNKHLNNDYTSISAGLAKVVTRIEELRKSDEHITGVPSGYKHLDAVTHGWQPTDFIVIAARPSVGKTAFALNLARNATLNDIKPVNVGFFSLEMSTGQLINRILSCESEIWLDRLLTGKLEDWQMDQVYKKGVIPLGKAKIFIDDSAGLNMFLLRSKARRMVNKDGVGLIIIDYLQLMSGKGNEGNREQEISKISRELKRLAKDLKVPVIALSQLSREIEKRASKVPQLSDLRESGAIEQDTDMVAFLYRPSVEESEQDADLRDLGMLTIKKHRNGSLQDFSFNVNNSIQKWTEIAALNTIVDNWKPIKNTT